MPKIEDDDVVEVIREVEVEETPDENVLSEIEEEEVNRFFGEITGDEDLLVSEDGEFVDADYIELEDDETENEDDEELEEEEDEEDEEEEDTDSPEEVKKKPYYNLGRALQAKRRRRYKEIIKQRTKKAKKTRAIARRKRKKREILQKKYRKKLSKRALLYELRTIDELTTQNFLTPGFSRSNYRKVKITDALTHQEQRFLNKFIEIGDLAKAVKHAGYQITSDTQARYKGNALISQPNIAMQLFMQTQLQKTKSIATSEEVMAFFTSVMRGEIKDQFGIEASIADRTAAAREIAKRTIDIEQKLKQVNPLTGAVGAETVKIDWKRDSAPQSADSGSGQASASIGQESI